MSSSDKELKKAKEEIIILKNALKELITILQYKIEYPELYYNQKIRDLMDS